ncbi:MAG: ABC transporter ATP-binding protein [Chloroflexi bacterium]|nr:ABC transporter ATP-binding protein [Chloroflexota bacterium]
MRPPSQSSPWLVELDDVVKKFGDRVVLDGLSLAIPGGRIHGVIGPSGCGKTTMIRVLLGVLAPTKGTARVFGVEPTKFKTRHREQIGYTPQGFFLYPTLTVGENARFVAGLYGLGWPRRRRRVREVLQFLELWEARNRLSRDISGGMQRRLELACALLHEPALLIVDEPTSGLDPVLRAKIWDYLRGLRDQGTSIIITTQHIDEAGNCDAISIMNRGQVAASGTPDELRRSTLGETVDVQAENLSREDIAALWRLPRVQRIDRIGSGSLRLTVDHVPTATPAITEALHARGAAVTSVKPYVPSFDEVFMKIVSEHDSKHQSYA